MFGPRGSRAERGPIKRGDHVMVRDVDGEEHWAVAKSPVCPPPTSAAYADMAWPVVWIQFETQAFPWPAESVRLATAEEMP